MSIVIRNEKVLRNSYVKEYTYRFKSSVLTFKTSRKCECWAISSRNKYPCSSGRKPIIPCFKIPASAREIFTSLPLQVSFLGRIPPPLPPLLAPPAWPPLGASPEFPFLIWLTRPPFLPRLLFPCPPSLDSGLASCPFFSSFGFASDFGGASVFSAFGA